MSVYSWVNSRDAVFKHVSCAARERDHFWVFSSGCWSFICHHSY